MREILSDDQKTKLDDLEAQMHSGPHGSQNGTSTPPSQN